VGRAPGFKQAPPATYLDLLFDGGRRNQQWCDFFVSEDRSAPSSKDQATAAKLNPPPATRYGEAPAAVSSRALLRGVQQPARIARRPDGDPRLLRVDGKRGSKTAEGPPTSSTSIVLGPPGFDFGTGGPCLRMGIRGRDGDSRWPKHLGPTDRRRSFGLQTTRFFPNFFFPGRPAWPLSPANNPRLQTAIRSTFLTRSAGLTRVITGNKTIEVDPCGRGKAGPP